MRKRFQIAAALLLVLSIAVNVILFRRYRESYTRLQQIQLDPLGLDHFANAEGFRADGGTRVLIFGDSRASEWPTPTGIEGCQFLNRGIGGQTTAQCLGRIDAHVISQRPEIVIVQMGINDLKAIPLMPELRSEVVDACSRRIIAQLERCLASGAKVILTTTIPVGDISPARRLIWSDAVDPAVMEVNARLKKWAEGKREVVVVDTESILAADSGHVSADFQRDFLHLNAAGYGALNAALVPILHELKEETPP